MIENYLQHLSVIPKGKYFLPYCTFHIVAEEVKKQTHRGKDFAPTYSLLVNQPYPNLQNGY